MKKVILMPDSFKGTMSSSEICGIMEKAVRAYYPDAEVVPIPVADGGEGSVDAFLAAVGGERVTVPVRGPYMEEMEGYYGLLDGGSTAVIEMAACAGLPLVGENRHAEKTTTYGVGQLMAHAAGRGCKKMIVGLGGSATNDFGAGAAAALGVRFLDEAGEEFVPVGENLARVAKIDMSGLLPALRGIEVITMCDIDNPLCGKNGAAHIFGPQKGADPAMVEYLDGQLSAIARTVGRELGRDVADLPGAGAAGGMGGGMVAFLGSRLQMGIETVLDTVGFDRLVCDADLVLSGEGKIDTQSLRGKVVIGVARRCKKHGVPLVALVGDIGDNIENAYEEGVSAVFSTNRVAVDFSVARTRSKSDMALTVDNLMRFLSRIGF
ncbi:glycerate kinase [Anaerotruncus massiliensis (ex Liu et al. 2021)]|uniref:Glycerate kinase n=2 Tax=Anaerotruncus TaxID=244127 RepID=A0A498CPU4_9FIRM|nr:MULTISPECIES: glycerate kinase [Anaerotruncus]MBC3937785.1 glycerate kinase [Anaerotruncus massiliensis (ex Togo et al. 2019)]RLL13784.1 glycerate kinase [Anaerotruncus massiliensis (ex Liu et al. 2021)]